MHLVRQVTHVAAASCLLWLSACSLKEAYTGRPDFDETSLTYPTTAPSPAKTPDDLISSSCHAGPTSTANLLECVYNAKIIIDNAYYKYRIHLHHTVDYGDAVFDVSTLTLNMVTAIVGGAATKTALAAVATGLGGTKFALNQDLLFNQTIEIVINQMDHDRDMKMASIINNINAPRSNYTFAMARSDLLDYLEVGTWDHAITALQTQVAANKVACQQQVEQAKTAAAQGTATPGTTSASSSGGACNASAPASMPSPFPGISIPTQISATAGVKLPYKIHVTELPGDAARIEVVPASLPIVTALDATGKAAPDPHVVIVQKSDIKAGGSDIEFDLTGPDPSLYPVFMVIVTGKAANGTYAGPTMPVSVFVKAGT